MKILNFIFTIILCVVTFSSIAVSADESVDAESFCKRLNSIDRKAARQRAAADLSDILKLTFRTKSFGTPVGESLQTNPLESNTGENLIFSMMPTQDVSNELNELDSVDQLFKKEQKKIHKLIHAKSFDSCVKKANQLKLDLNYINELSQKKQRLENATQSREAKLIHKLIHKAKHSLHLKWKVIESTRIEDVYNSLSNSQVRNIIIIAHAAETGQIFDSNQNGYPISFFKNLHSSLNSISIYSCHGEHVRTFYNLNSDTRFFTAKESEFLDKKGVAPILAFSSFLKAIDRTLSRGQKESSHIEPIEEDHKKCRLSLEGIEIQSGTFGVFFNSVFIGALLKNSQNLIEYDCALENQNNNTVIVRDLNLKDHSVLTLSENASVKTNVNFVLKLFKRDDQTIRVLRADSN